MPKYRATLQTRTTLEQAGRIAGIAGELDVSEAEVTRRLIDRALADGGPQLLRSLRAEIARDLAAAEREPSQDEIDRAIAEQRVTS